MGKVQLAQIREESNGTTSNNAYPRFSCNYSFLAANSFYVIPVKPQETSLNSCQFASNPAEAGGDPVNNFDPSGLTCQDVEQAVVLANDQHIQMDAAAIRALEMTCQHHSEVQYLIQGNNESASMGGDQNHSILHQLAKNTMNVGNDLKGFGQGAVSVVDSNVRCTGPMSSCYVGAATLQAEAAVASAGSLYYGTAVIRGVQVSRVVAAAYSVFSALVDTGGCLGAHDVVNCGAAMLSVPAAGMASGGMYIGSEATLGFVDMFGVLTGIGASIIDAIGGLGRLVNSGCGSS